MRIIYMLVAILGSVLPAPAADPSLNIESVTKIWGEALHCAFTDLTYWKGQFICAFREGRAHVATDGKIRILASKDGESWSPAALVQLDGFDLRDAGLSVTPDGRLMLNGGAAPRKNFTSLFPSCTAKTRRRKQRCGLPRMAPRIACSVGMVSRLGSRRCLGRAGYRTRNGRGPI
jgi:hypothetical protein